MYIMHFTAPHLGKWIRCTARLTALGGPMTFCPSQFPFLNPALSAVEEHKRNTKVGSGVKGGGSGDEWRREILWFDTKVMRFDWTRGGELIDSERLEVEAQQVCVGWRGPSRHFGRRCIPLIYSLTLFECEKAGETGGASSFLENLCHPFHFQAEQETKRGGRRGADLCCPVRIYLTTPVWPQTDGAFSLPKRLHTPFMLIPLLSSMPFLFLSPPPRPPLFCCRGNAIWHGLSLCKLGWGALTRTACKIILGAAQRQVIKLNFRPVDLIGTGN